MVVIEILAKKFEFKKDNGICNIPECSKKTDKYVILREHHMRNILVKDLGKIFLCDKHTHVVDGLLKELNEKVREDFKSIKAQIY